MLLTDARPKQILLPYPGSTWDHPAEAYAVVEVGSGVVLAVNGQGVAKLLERNHLALLRVSKAKEATEVSHLRKLFGKGR